MLRHLLHLALAVLALTVLAAPAIASVTTFALSPTNGPAILQCAWTDTVTLSDPSSTWTRAVLNKYCVTTSTATYPFVTVLITATNEFSALLHGGTLTVNFNIYDPGYYDFTQVDSGLDPNYNAWSTGSQDIYVTVTLNNIGP